MKKTQTLNQIFTKIPMGLFNLMLMLFGVVLFTSLAIWQWHRGQEKQELINLYQSRSNESAISLSQALKISDPRYLHVKAVGLLNTKNRFLLDNQFYNHQMGYQVITPLWLPDDKKFILVNQGWIKAPPSRKDKPLLNQSTDVQTIKAEHGNLQTIKGIISIPSQFSLFNSMNENESWPKRILSVDIKAIEQVLKRPVYPFLILQDPEKGENLTRQWTITVISPQRHYAYALQWLIFALITIGIYIKSMIKKRV